MADQKSKLEALCAERGLKMTDQRRVIARVVSDSQPDPVSGGAAQAGRRGQIQHFNRHGIGTIRLFEEAASWRSTSSDARYEETPSITTTSMTSRPARSSIAIEDLQRRIAEKAGYRLVGHVLELYGVPLDGKSDGKK